MAIILVIEVFFGAWIENTLGEYLDFGFIEIIAMMTLAVLPTVIYWNYVADPFIQKHLNMPQLNTIYKANVVLMFAAPVSIIMLIYSIFYFDLAIFSISLFLISIGLLVFFAFRK